MAQAAGRVSVGLLLDEVPGGSAVQLGAANLSDGRLVDRLVGQERGRASHLYDDDLALHHEHSPGALISISTEMSADCALTSS